MEITNPTLYSEREYISFRYEMVVDPPEILFPKIFLKIHTQDKYEMHLFSSVLACNYLTLRNAISKSHTRSPSQSEACPQPAPAQPHLTDTP